jgi:eukaryotic-like serine/threonine-protein kinase
VARVTPSSPCLDDNTLVALVRGRLKADELARAHEHLDACPPCRRLTARFAERFEPLGERCSSPDSYALGRYFVIGDLGRGGMGRVLLAYDSKLDRKVALKQIRSRELDLSLEARAWALREARAMARTSHPNVLAVYDADEIDGQIFIAIEYLEGRTLREWLRQPRSWREILAVFCAAGEGLAAVHRAGLVHRDFKPDNVLVGNDGRVCLMDFGLARPETMPGPALGRVEPEDGSILERPQSGSSALSGTPGYIAPEALRKERGPLSDQFSFFVSLWEALCGARPFDGPSLLSQLIAAERGEVRAVSRERAVPARLRRLMLVGLASDSGRRFPSMAQALVALRREAGSQESMSPPRLTRSRLSMRKAR